MIGEVSDRRATAELVDGLNERSVEVENDLFRLEEFGNHDPDRDQRSGSVNEAR